MEKLKQILPAGMTLPEMALRFILSHPAVSTTIAGMRKPEHVRQNIAASDAGPLDKDLLAELKKASLGPKAAALVGLEDQPQSGQKDGSSLVAIEPGSLPAARSIGSEAHFPKSRSWL